MKIVCSLQTLWTVKEPVSQFSPNLPNYFTSNRIRNHRTLPFFHTTPPGTHLTHCICESICMHSVKMLFLQAAKHPTYYSASWLVCWPVVNIYKNVIVTERPREITRTLKKEGGSLLCSWITARSQC